MAYRSRAHRHPAHPPPPRAPHPDHERSGYKFFAPHRRAASLVMSSLELLAWALLILVLLRALVSLEQIYSLLRPDAPSPPPLSGVPRVLLRKAALTLKGAVYLVLSRDKVSSSALRRTIDPAELEPSRVTREAAPLPAPPRRGLPRGAAGSRRRSPRPAAGAPHLCEARRVGLELGLQSRCGRSRDTYRLPLTACCNVPLASPRCSPAATGPRLRPHLPSLYALPVLSRPPTPSPSPARVQALAPPSCGAFSRRCCTSG